MSFLVFELRISDVFPAVVHKQMLARLEFESSLLCSNLQFLIPTSFQHGNFRRLYNQIIRSSMPSRQVLWCHRHYTCETKLERVWPSGRCLADRCPSQNKLHSHPISLYHNNNLAPLWTANYISHIIRKVQLLSIVQLCAIHLQYYVARSQPCLPRRRIQLEGADDVDVSVWRASTSSAIHRRIVNKCQMHADAADVALLCQRRK